MRPYVGIEASGYEMCREQKSKRDLTKTKSKLMNN